MPLGSAFQIAFNEVCISPKTPDAVTIKVMIPIIVAMMPDDLPDTSFALGLKSDAMMCRVSWTNSIIRWQGYRVSASRLAESNFRYTQPAILNL